MAWRTIALLAAVLGLAVPGAASAQKRVALVIGNGAYTDTARLANTTNDAPDMAAALQRLGFEVLQGVNLDKRAMERLIRQFDQSLAGAEIALFFYAGHGMQVSGQNYLVPIDARLAAEGDIDFESLPLSLVLSRMEREAKTSLVLLDACRDNPLARNLARTMGTRAANVGQGLAEVKTGIGTLLSFSTQPGNVALDGRGRNSPYTTALLAEIETPGRDVLTTLAAVRGAVVKATGGKQVPWEHTSLLGPVVLKAVAAPTVPAPPPALAPVPPAQQSAAAEAWPLVRETRDPHNLEIFIQRFGDTFYGDLAKRRLTDVKAAAAEQQRTALLDQQKRDADASAAKQTTVAEAARQRADAAAAPQPGRVFRDCADCPEMIVVPAGNFMMGSTAAEIADLMKMYPGFKLSFNAEGPQRRVTIAKPFAVGKFEVTFAEWDACAAGSGCAANKKPGDEGWGRGKRPVIDVSWEDAQQYTAWLTNKTGKSYRLLTEAEWEYAARGSTTTRYSFGNELSNAQANIDKGKTVDVGQYPANAFGLHDMHGNVWEWVQDCYKDTLVNTPTTGQSAPDVDSCFRVVRGGSWGIVPQLLRSANRSKESTVSRSLNLGLRVARTLP